MKRFFCFLLSAVFAVLFASVVALSDITRIEIYNVGGKENHVEVLSRVGNRNPEWCKKENGQCAILEIRNFWFWQKRKITLKTVGKGELLIKFSGQWHASRGKKDKLFPQYADYKSLIINNEQIGGNALLRKNWYNNPFEWKKNVENGSVLNIKFLHRYHPGIKDYYYFIALSVSFLLFVSLVFYARKDTAPVSVSLSSATKKSFLDEFDYFRGMAIFLIVLGHVLYRLNSYAGTPLNIYDDAFGFRYWYAYELLFIWDSTALFVFISGFLFYYVFYQRGFDYEKFLTNKFKNVISPYFIIIFLLIVIRFSIEKGETVYNKDWFFSSFWYNAFWYIPFITIIFAASPFFTKFISANNKNQTLFLIGAVTYSLFTARNQSNPWQSSVFWASYYLFGIYIAMRYERFKTMTFEKMMMIALSFFIFVAISLSIDKENVWLRSVQGWKFRFHFDNLKVVSKLLQCLLLLSVCLFLKERTSKFALLLKKGLHFLAKYSFSIFFLHVFLIFAIERNSYDIQAFMTGRSRTEVHVFSYLLTIMVCALCGCFAMFVKKFAGKRSRMLIGS